PLHRQRARPFRKLAIIADLNADGDALHLEDRVAIAWREVELLVGSRAALEIGRKDRRDVRFSIRANQTAVAVEDSGGVVETLAVLLAVGKDDRHVVLAGCIEQRLRALVGQRQEPLRKILL